MPTASPAVPEPSTTLDAVGGAAVALGQIAGLQVLGRMGQVSHWAVGLLVLGGALLLVWWAPRVAATSGPARRLADSPWPLLVFAVAAAVAVALLYPIADGRRAFGAGSDQDDALLLAVRWLVGGQYPYAERTYLGNAISTGPGWLVAHVPVVVLGVYHFLAPALLAVTAAALGQARGSWRAATFFLVIVCSSPGLWAALVSGSDLVSASCAVILVLVLFEGEPGRGRLAGAWTLAVLVASSRVVLGFLIPVFALARARRAGRRGWYEGLAALAACVALHAVFYFWGGGSYAPLHVVGKARALLPGALEPVAWIGAAAVAVLAFKSMRAELRSQLLWTGIALLWPFLVTSLVGLRQVPTLGLAAWSTAGQLVVPFIVLAAAAACPAGSRAATCPR
jgi:hypothetical protein